MRTHPAPLTEGEALDLLGEFPAFLTLHQAALATSLSRSTIRRRVASGSLRALRSCDERGACLRFLKGDLARLLVSMSEPGMSAR